ncbi:MAG TPA: hypothetical protein VND24_05245 [Steroidobacteraceae bacterium]|nr:hypothetical protein [Steroidobacteraceae bacterium]
MLERLRRLSKPAPRGIELDLVQQRTVLTLLRFGECSFARLEGEVDAIRGAKPAEMVMAVMKLEQEKVLERLNPRTEGRQVSTYRLTSTGRKAGRRIPRPPRSLVTVYV